MSGISGGQIVMGLLAIVVFGGGLAALKLGPNAIGKRGTPLRFDRIMLLRAVAVALLAYLLFHDPHDVARKGAGDKYADTSKGSYAAAIVFIVADAIWDIVNRIVCWLRS